MGGHVPYVNTLGLRITGIDGYNIFDQDGQAVTNISSLNGVLQFDYGVNGFQAHKNAKKIDATSNSRRISFYTMNKNGNSRLKLGVGGANPYSNSPNLHTFFSKKFSFLQNCKAVVLEPTTNDETFRVSARCDEGVGRYHTYQATLTMIGQNGRYAIGDELGRQIQDIILQNGVLAPIYANEPTLETIFAHKFSCLSPHLCLRNSFTLTKTNIENVYILSATCNQKNNNKKTSINLMVKKVRGTFTLRSMSDEPISDIVLKEGEFQMAPLANLLTAIPVNTFSQICKNISLSRQKIEPVPFAYSASPSQTGLSSSSTTSMTTASSSMSTSAGSVPPPALKALKGAEIYILRADCPNAEHKQLIPNELQLYLTHEFDSFHIYNTQGKECDRVVSVNGALFCSVQPG